MAIVWPVTASAQLTLQVSTAADRSAAAALAGQVFDRGASLYVFVPSAPGITRVRFYVDDPEMSGPPRSIERRPPWDLAGGTPRAANSLPMSDLSEGAHTITAAIERGAGRVEVVSASFSVAGAPPAVVKYRVSKSPVSLEFPASPDHDASSNGVPILARYELRCYLEGASGAFQVVDLGKPAPDSRASIRVNLRTRAAPLPVGTTYDVRIAAVGPHGVSVSEPIRRLGSDLSVPRILTHPPDGTDVP